MVWGMSTKTVFKWIGVMTTVLIFYITFIIICIWIIAYMYVNAPLRACALSLGTQLRDIWVL